MHALRRSIVALAALALTASLGAGAAATDEPAGDEPDGTSGIEDLTWLLTHQLVDGVRTEISPRTTVSLRMEDGDAGGSGGCNSYFTSYELDGQALRFGQIGSTTMACLQPVMAIEQAYFRNLARVVAYQSGGRQLAFLDEAGGLVLEFELAPEATVVGSWVAQGINNGTGGVESNAYTSLVSAEFDEDGRLSGSDGCNRYTTTYEVEGDSISIAPEIATTLMACEEPALASLSQQYFAALTAATTWAIDASGSLELRDDAGALQVNYLPAG
jgi:heat shock protein HslJ